MSNLHHTSGVLLILIAGCAAGCEDRSPLGLFSGCIRAGIVTIQSGEDRTELDCPLEAESLVVGLPGRKLSVDEILEAGLSKNLADLFASSELTYARWCTVEEFEPQPIPVGVERGEFLLTNSECVSTDLEVPRVVHARARWISATLERSPSGRVTLVKFEGR
jgi:hypothetical protein